MKISVFVKPNVKQGEGIELVDGVYEVRVKAPATEGKANEALVRLLAGHFKVAKSRITLLRGHTSRRKVFEVDSSGFFDKV